MAQASANPVKQEGSSDISYYVCSLIGILFIFGFGYLPPIEPVTPLGMKVLGIFIGMIFLWSCVSILWPSLLGIIALGLSGYAPMPVILKSAFGDVIVLLTFFVMVLFGAVQQAGVTHYVSRWFLTRKIINGRPVMFSFIFIFATFMLSSATSVLPVLLFMWAILYSVLEDVGYKKGDPYTAVMVIGTMFGAICGQAVKPFTGSALMILGSFGKVSKTQIDYLPYMAFGLIMGTLCIIGYSLLIKFVFRPDMAKIQDINIERFKKTPLPPMDLRKKILFSCLFGYLALVLLPSIFPQSFSVIWFLSTVGPWGVAMLLLIMLTMVKINGQPLIDFKEVAGKQVVWDVVFLVAMSMVISDALVAKNTGITEFLTNMLNPMLGGHSPYALTVVLVLFSVAITQVANNAVMGVMLMPVVQVFSAQSGGNFAAIAVIMIFALHVAILTPAASPFAAVLFGNKDWVSQREIARYGGGVFAMALLLYLFLGIPLVNMLFGS